MTAPLVAVWLAGFLLLCGLRFEHPGDRHDPWPVTLAVVLTFACWPLVVLFALFLYLAVMTAESLESER